MPPKVRRLKSHVFVAIAVYVIAACGSLTALSAAEKPNFVVIMADDLGAAELSCYGNTTHMTPHLDKLAKEGMRFRTCWATPLCTPTRVLIMTGQYGFRTGYYNFIHRVYAPRRGSELYDIGSKLTFADVLKDAGYATAAVGKWQLTGQLPTLIRDCGFDEYLMWTWLHKLPPGVVHSGAWQSKRRRLPSRFWHPGILSNGKYVATQPQDYGPDLYTDFAIDFMTRQRDRPFLLYYPMCLTHRPWDKTPDPENSGSTNPKGLKSNVEYMDHVVGRIIGALNRLELRGKTIVIFTGDNGTQGAGKAKVTEMGARVPLIVSCPGVVKTGAVSDALVDLSDICPTVVEFAGAKLPAGHVIDGKSFAEVLTGKAPSHREWIFSYLADERMLRDKRWLLEGSGKFFDCGNSRAGTGYQEVTDSADPQVVAARKRFAATLAHLPGPQPDQDLIRPSGKQKAKKK